MYILEEEAVSRDVGRLDQAWEDPRSFVFLPRKGAPPLPWVEQAMSRLPAQLHEGHFVLATSGSTGLPKLVVGERGRAERLARVLHEVQDSSPVRTTVGVLPLTYCYSFVNQWLWARVMGREFLPTEGFRKPDELKRILAAASDCMLCLVGALVPMFPSQLGEDVSFPNVCRLHFAGGMYPQGHQALLQQLFPNATVFNNYGCAEAMPRLTVRRRQAEDEGANIGSPLPGIRMRTNESDEILFQSPFAAVAVYESERFFVPGEADWIATGDLGEEMKDGTWRVKGRSSEVFKRYGEKVSLARLMSTVTQAWRGQAAFYRERDPAGEEGHVLVLAPRVGAGELQEVLQAFRKHHPRTHWPLRVESVPDLPLLSSGKPDLLRLSESAREHVVWRQRL